MKVVCIRGLDDMSYNDQVNLYNGIGSIKIGNKYEVLEAYAIDYYKILNDFGNIDLYPKNRFKLVEKIREEKINLIFE